MAIMANKKEDEVHREVMEVRDEEKEQRTQPIEELESFTLGKEHPEKTFNMNANMDSE